ncbi:MAG: hypothetical protein JNL88_11005 [Bacteroidia bacterium]|nr:hypothetical protein [Bacteroidia bacterium]
MKTIHMLRGKMSSALVQKIMALMVLTVLMAASSCRQKDDDPFASKVPQIELRAVQPQVAVEFSDSIVFRVYYRDNDGDLGENDPDVKNLFLTDNRIGVRYEYRIQQLAPSGSAVPIEGNLNVVLNTVARTDTSLAQETATFSIYVIDRAGNKSNTVTSGPVTIQQP